MTQTTDIRTIETELERLYQQGHVSGYGAGRATCGGGEQCMSCATARGLADDWSAWWQEFDRQRLARAD